MSGDGMANRPTLATADVVVAGAGPAGLGAALAAARQGTKTLLVEYYGFLGGMWTIGGVNEFNARSDSSDLLQELIDRMEKQPGCAQVRRDRNRLNVKFEPEGMKRVLDDYVRDAGIDVLLHAPVVDTLVGPDRAVQGIVLGVKKGLSVIRGTCTVDATGDGDVAAFGGAAFELGREEDGLTAAPTLVFRIGQVDIQRVFETFRQDEEVDGRDFAHVRTRFEQGEPIRVYEFSENALRLAQERGCDLGPDDVALFSEPKHPDLFHTGPLPGVVTVNMAHMANVDLIDPGDLTRTEVDVRRRIERFMRFLTAHVPGFENAFLIDSGPHIGIRETRRIVGDYQLTGADLDEGSRFEDEIMVLAPSVDIHHPDGRGTTKHGGKRGVMFGIPYRCLVPKDLEGLLLAGRCISATVEANIKGTAKCMGIGHAAGTAAALSVAGGILPRQLAVHTLRARLRNDGVLKKEAHS